MYKFIAVFMISLMVSPLYAGTCRIRSRDFQQDFVVRQKTVEFDADYFLGSDGYYGVAAQLQESEKGTITSQQEQINQLLDIVKTLVDHKGAVAPTPTPVDTEDKGEGDVGTDLDAKAFEIFTNNCASCHDDEKSSGGFSIMGEGFMYDLTLAERVNIYDRVAGIHLKDRNLALMPKGKSPLSDEDVSTIWLWTVERAKAQK